MTNIFTFSTWIALKIIRNDEKLPKMSKILTFSTWIALKLSSIFNSAVGANLGIKNSRSPETRFPRYFKFSRRNRYVTIKKIFRITLNKLK